MLSFYTAVLHGRCQQFYVTRNNEMYLGQHVKNLLFLYDF